MIHSVAVRAGDGESDRRAQDHALDVARLFHARLTVLVVREPSDPKAAGRGKPAIPPEHAVGPAARELAERARERGLAIRESLRGENSAKSLLAESRECDLLVVGAPGGEGPEYADEREMLKDLLPVLRKAEASLLVAGTPRRALRKILALYPGGIEGKTAVRLAGDFAEKARADLAVLAVAGTVAKTEIYSSSAKVYLEPFKVGTVDTIEHRGKPDSLEDLFSVIEPVQPDLLVVGSRPPGMVERFFGAPLSKKVPLAATCPVLVAR